MWHAHAHDMSGLPVLIRASVIIFVITCKGSVICLFVQCIKVKYMLYYFYTYIFDFILYFSYVNGCVGWKLCSRLWVWNGLPLKTYISMYTRTKRCWNERGSRTSYVHFSILHCINYINAEANNIFITETKFLKIHILQHGQQISIFVFICHQCIFILMYGTNNVRGP